LRTRRRAAVTQRPDALYADRGYDQDKYRKQVREATIKPVIARRGEQSDSGLGVYRWVVEQGFALLHWFRRLCIRWENRRRGSRVSVDSQDEGWVHGWRATTNGQ
jgi:transposase